MQSTDDILKINREYWNKRAIREKAEKEKWLKRIKSNAPYIEEMEPKLAPYLKDIVNKKIIVLQFGDGLLMLACAKRGAIVWGVDFSDEQIRIAENSAKYCGVNVKLVKADCQNLPESIPNDYFDLAIAECGVFLWIKDLDAWMKNAYKVLKKGGKLVVSDFHPLSIIAEEKEGGIVVFRRSYFDESPDVYQPKENEPPHVEFVWKFSDVINSAIHAGFKIEYVEEYYVKKGEKKVPVIPTDFLLVGVKM